MKLLSLQSVQLELYPIFSNITTLMGNPQTLLEEGPEECHLLMLET